MKTPQAEGYSVAARAQSTFDRTANKKPGVAAGLCREFVSPSED
jgi:hypothetical protein